MTHPKVRAMAQEIAATATRRLHINDPRAIDDLASVAITAIERTTELAEDWLRHDLDDWPDYVAPADLADAIADFPHLF